MCVRPMLHRLIDLSKRNATFDTLAGWCRWLLTRCVKASGGFHWGAKLCAHETFRCSSRQQSWQWSCLSDGLSFQNLKACSFFRSAGRNR